MFRYIVVIWATDSEEQACAAQLIATRLKSAQWDEPMRTQGMRVFQCHGRHQGLTAQALPLAAGVVIGKTFERVSDVLDDMPAPQWSATPFEAEAILASRGRWLIDRCWGNYVAILRSAASRRVWILKDPAGSLPCFVASSRGVTLIFSAADDLVRLGLCSFTIDRAYLRSRVLHGADFDRPPLNEVDRIRGGECVELDPDTGHLHSRQFLWLPHAFAHSEDAIEDPDTAAQAMRASVRMSTQTWAALGSTVVHHLSGDPASSIIASCLADAPNRPCVCSYAFANRAASEDRQWASLLAAQLSFEHSELDLSARDFQLRRAPTPALHVEPVSTLTYTARAGVERQVARQADASIVFDDEGGDAAFGAEAVRYAATEYLRHQGLSPEVLRIAARVALHTHESTWSVLYRALTASLTGAFVDPVVGEAAETRRLINREALRNAWQGDPGTHPWFPERGHRSAALMRRVKPLLTIGESHDVLTDAGALEFVSPLCSQPVVETLLRIPLYRLFEGGRECGLARRAFSQDVPEQILARSWKRRMPQLEAQLVDCNRPFLREVLLDGRLVREGLLDRTALEDALSGELPHDSALTSEIMQHFDVEMWVRAWTASVQQPRQQSVPLSWSSGVRDRTSDANGLSLRAEVSNRSGRGAAW